MCSIKESVYWGLSGYSDIRRGCYIGHCINIRYRSVRYRSMQESPVKGHLAVTNTERRDAYHGKISIYVCTIYLVPDGRNLALSVWYRETLLILTLL